jgi:lysozyme family protein
MAASNREFCIKATLKHEGGYVDHPSDPGGATNWGITIGVAREYWKPDATKADIKAMPQSVAVEIYRKRYWNAVKGDDLPAGLDFAVYDFGVNSGPARALKYLKATSGSTEKRIIDLCDARLAFVKGLKTWPTFGKGWGRRIAEVKATALKMAKGADEPLPAPPDIPKPPKTPTQSKTLWSVLAQIGAAIGTALSALAGLDWKVVAVIAALIVALALFIGRERLKRLFEDHS